VRTPQPHGPVVNQSTVATTPVGPRIEEVSELPPAGTSQAAVANHTEVDEEDHVDDTRDDTSSGIDWQIAMEEIAGRAFHSASQSFFDQQVLPVLEQQGTAIADNQRQLNRVESMLQQLLGLPSDIPRSPPRREHMDSRAVNQDVPRTGTYGNG
jgi:hypothetical protein